MKIEQELKTYLQVLWRYKWVIAACGIIALVAALAISFLLTPQYTATATLRVASAPGGVTDYSYIYSSTRLTNTYVEIAGSEKTLDEVAKRLNLPKRPEIDVQVLGETELITIKCSDPDPARARDIVNTLGDLMVQQSAQLFGGNAPTARQILEQQLAQAKADLDKAVSDYAAALRNVPTPDSPDANKTPTPSPELATIEKILGVRQQIYGDLLQKYEQARIGEEVRSNSITLVEPATLPLKPSSPNKTLNAVLGLVAGLAVGMILAFLFESMDDTVHNLEDVQEITGLSVLSRIPKEGERFDWAPRLFHPQDGHLTALPACEQLRARLLLHQGAKESNIVVVTSAEPGAGKSSIIANLGMSLAEAGHSVVLVDMDFNRPRLHSIFRVSNAWGLSNMMRGECELDTLSQETPLPHLRVITAGPSADIPKDWMTPVKVRELMGRMSQGCKYLLVDTPALLSIAEASLFAAYADAVILVVAQRETERKQLRFAVQQLRELEAKVVGVVINKVPKSRTYNYYYYRRKNDKFNLPFQKTDSASTAESVKNS